MSPVKKCRPTFNSGRHGVDDVEGRTPVDLVLGGGRRQLQLLGRLLCLTSLASASQSLVPFLQLLEVLLPLGLSLLPLLLRDLDLHLEVDVQVRGEVVLVEAPKLDIFTALLGDSIGQTHQRLF